MTRANALAHRFVDHIPDRLDDATLYISMQFAIAVHRCCCGCGTEIATPLSPTDWEMTFDGETISLYPSIGNWSLPCRSHYWINRGRVRWAPAMPQREIDAGRAADREAKAAYYSGSRSEKTAATRQPIVRKTWWRRLLARWE